MRLKEYKETLDGAEGKELVQDIAPYQYFPVVSRIAAGKTVDDAVPFTADKRGDLAVSDRPETVVLTGKLADGTTVRKTYTLLPGRVLVRPQGRDGRDGPQLGDVRGLCRDVPEGEVELYLQGAFRLRRQEARADRSSTSP